MGAERRSDHQAWNNCHIHLQKKGEKERERKERGGFATTGGEEGREESEGAASGLCVEDQVLFLPRSFDVCCPTGRREGENNEKRERGGGGGRGERSAADGGAAKWPRNMRADGKRNAEDGMDGEIGKNNDASTLEMNSSSARK